MPRFYLKMKKIHLLKGSDCSELEDFQEFKKDTIKSKTKKQEK